MESPFVQLKSFTLPPESIRVGMHETMCEAPAFVFVHFRKRIL